MNREQLRLMLAAQSLLGKGNDMGVIDMLAAAIGLTYGNDKAGLAQLLGAGQVLINYYTEAADDL